MKMKKKQGLALLVVVMCLVIFSAVAVQDVKHYLMLGEDGYDKVIREDARTDTVVLVTLDTRYNRIICTSILRDSMITSLRGNPIKVNVLYKNLGLDGMVECIERALKIDIEGAILVNFEHVKPVIDALGGVDLQIDINELIAIRKILLGKDPNMPTSPGMVHMTGRIALAYMRDRSTGMGDFSRTQRQRKVVRQLFDKCRSLSLPELIDVYNSVSAGMVTNLSQMDIIGVMARGYQLVDAHADFVDYHIPQPGTYSYTTLDGSSVLDVRWNKNGEKFRAMLETSPEGETK